MSRGHRFIVGAESFHDAGPKAFDENVRGLRERKEHVAIVRLREIENYAALVAIEREKWRVVIPCHAKLGPAHGTREVAGGRLDLDDIRAQVTELHGAVRSAHDLREVDDAHAVEGKIHSSNSRLHDEHMEGVRYESRIRKR